ncbi:MAG: tRNA uridine-5-carboxymethylaminomethyl(34) synthesis GTPase MnmE [Bacillota bacterium]|jgi:tRNA modification GTPase
MKKTANKLSEYGLDETIAAIATPIGSGGISIVRLSGKKSLKIGLLLSQLTELPARQMKYSNLYDQNKQLIDEALVVYMPAPHSYTGEDVVELQCHGGMQSPTRVLAAAIAAGARLAQPGEYTLRAFLHGRVDLTQAEAVNDLIDAPTPQAADMLAQQLTGKLSRALQAIEDELLDILAQIEVGVDFPDDEDALSSQEAITQIKPLIKQIKKLLAGAQEGRIIKEGIKTCLLGATNVGKSSILNALLAEERAIVTSVPGTTRDVIEEYLNLGGLPIILSDTAGLRESADEVETLGIDKTHQVAESAQLILLVLDGSRPLLTEEESLLTSFNEKKIVVIVNKNDLAGAKETINFVKKQYPQVPCISVSAKTGDGLDQLEQTIKQLVLTEGLSGQRDHLINNARHQEALISAKKSLERSIKALNDGYPVDIAAIDLEEAWQYFGEISGKTAGEEVIARIFSKFCLGK